MPRPSSAPTLLPPIDREAAEARRLQLRRELAPAGVLQAMLVDQIAQATTRLGVAAEWELRVEPGDPAWTRYQQQAERTLHRSMLELRRLSKPVRAAHGAGHAAPTADVPGPTPGPPAPPPRCHAPQGNPSREAPPRLASTPVTRSALPPARTTQIVGDAFPCGAWERGAVKWLDRVGGGGPVSEGHTGRARSASAVCIDPSSGRPPGVDRIKIV